MRCGCPTFAAPPRKSVCPVSGMMLVDCWGVIRDGAELTSSPAQHCRTSGQISLSLLQGSGAGHGRPASACKSNEIPREMGQ